MSEEAVKSTKKTSSQQGMPDILGGPVLKVIIQLTIPIIISYLVNDVYLMVDTYFISMIGKGATAAVAGAGLIFPMENIFEAVSSGMAGGFCITVGRLVGEGKLDICKKFGSIALTIGLVIGLPFLIICYAGGPSLIAVLGGSGLSQEACEYALTYMYTIAPGVLFNILSQVIGGILVGQGLAEVTTKGFMMVTVLNFILDPILMFGLKLGVAGAGLSTTIALFAAFLYILRNINGKKTIFKVDFNLKRIDWTHLWEVVRMGLPILLMSMVPVVMVMFFNRIISVRFGESTMNAWALNGRVEELIIVPAIGFVSAIVVFASQNFGAGNLKRIKEALKHCTILVFVISTLVAVLYVILAKVLYANFTQNSDVLDYAVWQVRITAFTMAFLAASLVAGSLFQAMGKPVRGLILICIRVLLIMVLAVVLVYLFNTSVVGIFIAIAVGNILAVPIAYGSILRYMKKIS